MSTSKVRPPDVLADENNTVTLLPDPPLTTGAPVVGKPSGRRRVVAVSVAVVLLLGGGTTAVVMARHAENQRADAVRSAQSSCSTARQAVADMGAAVTGAGPVLESTSGQVADEATRTALSTAVADAGKVGAAPKNVPGNASRDTARQADQACATLTATARTATERTTVAVAGVQLSNAVWLLAADQTSATTAVDAANALVAETEGRVTDDATRQALAAAVAAVVAARDVQPGATPEAIGAQREALSAAVAAMAGPQQAVTESRAAWQAAEEARQAAAAAAAAEAARSSQTSRSSSGGSKSSAPKSSGGSSSGGSTAPAAPSAPKGACGQTICGTHSAPARPGAERGDWVVVP